MTKIELVESAASADVAQELMAELSEKLRIITGSDGRSSFNEESVADAGACFLLAMFDNAALGCAALRPLADEAEPATAEIKRMYSRQPGKGIGKLLLTELEQRARAFGYRRIVLETRKVNLAAVSFYQNNGYRVCENYGRYIGRVEAICFEKFV